MHRQLRQHNCGQFLGSCGSNPVLIGMLAWGIQSQNASDVSSQGCMLVLWPCVRSVILLKWMSPCWLLAAGCMQEMTACVARCSSLLLAEIPT